MTTIESLLQSAGKVETVGQFNIDGDNGTLKGGACNDTLIGGAGNDVLQGDVPNVGGNIPDGGGNGRDYLDGEEANEKLYGFKKTNWSALPPAIHQHRQTMRYGGWQHEHSTDLPLVIWSRRHLNGACIVLLLLLTTALSACNKSNAPLKWTEDVRLPDGRVVTLTRYQEFKGPHELGDTPSESDYWFEFKHPDTGEVVRWQSDRDLETLALMMDGKVPVLLLISQKYRRHLDV
jgi:hypothetical protein